MTSLKCPYRRLIYRLKHSGHAPPIIDFVNTHKPYKPKGIVAIINNVKKYGKAYIMVYVAIKVIEISLILWLVLR